MLTSIDDDPKSIGEEFYSTKGKILKDSMVEERESLYKNETWDLIKLPRGIKQFGSKWVFKKNLNVAGQVHKFKYQFVVKGYSQVEGVNFGDIFSPIAKLTLHYCIWVKFRRRVRRNCHFLLSEDRQTSDPLKRRFT
jgi:hypothetical protein